MHVHHIKITQSDFSLILFIINLINFKNNHVCPQMSAISFSFSQLIRIGTKLFFSLAILHGQCVSKVLNLSLNLSNLFLHTFAVLNGEKWLIDYAGILPLLYALSLKLNDLNCICEGLKQVFSDASAHANVFGEVTNSSQPRASDLRVQHFNYFCSCIRTLNSILMVLMIITQPL